MKDYAKSPPTSASCLGNRLFELTMPLSSRRTELRRRRAAMAYVSDLQKPGADHDDADAGLPLFRPDRKGSGHLPTSKVIFQTDSVRPRVAHMNGSQRGRASKPLVDIVVLGQIRAIDIQFWTVV